MAANENIELLAAKLKPIIVGWLPRHAVNSSAAGDVTVGTHALNSSFHTGTLGRSQAPWVAEDIDTDIATHTALPNAHHAQSHVLATNVGLGADHTVSGLTAGQYLRATAANAAVFAAILDADLPNTIVRTSRQVIAGSGLTGGGNLGADVTLNVGAGALISVAADSVALASGTAQYQVPVTSANPYTPGWTALSGFAGDGLEFASGVFNVLAGDGLQIATDYVALVLSATSGLELTGTTPNKTLQVADTIAGAGLTIASKVLAVGAGTLISVAADSVGVSPGSAQYQIPMTGTTPFAPTWTGLGTLAGDGIVFGTNFAVELSATSGLELTGSSPAKTLQLADTVAGAGLTIASKVLAVGAGTLITVAADAVGLSVGSAQYQVPVTGANPYTPGWTDLSTFAGDGLTFSAGTFNVGAGALITVAANTVGVSNGTAQYQVPVTGATPFAPDWIALGTMAGTGLSFASGVFTVNAGDGLVFATDDLALELSVTSGLEMAGTSPNKTLQLADTVAGAGLTIASKVLAVGAGNGITVAADTVALTTPGTLTVSTTNNAAGSHTHAVTSSSAPGATASLLASDATGKLTLPLMVASTSLATPLVTTGAGVSLTLQPTLDLILDPDSNIVRSGGNVSLQASSFASQTTGWRITDIGEADFRYLFVDEMHAKSFIADLEQALAGGQIIAKSVTTLGADFVLPAAGLTGTLRVKDLPSAPNMQVFEVGDFVGLRQFSRAAGSLTIGWAWGTVTAYVDGTAGNEGTQTWTFTRHAVTPGAATGTIYKDAIILDFGVSGNGYYEVNAIDGIYGINSPYAQIVTWATHPATRSVRTRFGNLRGITSQDNEFGIFAGSGTAVTDRSVRASSHVIELRNVPLNLYDGSAMTMQLSAGASNNSPYMALGSPLPTAPLVNNGIWLGLDSSAYKFRVGNVNTGALTSGMYWDGSVLLIGSATAENLYATGSAVQMRVGSTVHAQLASSTLTLGVTANGDYITIDGTNGVCLYANSTLLGQWTAAGGVVIGSVANNTSRVEIASGAINMISKSGAGVDTTFVNMTVAGVLTLGDTSNENVVVDTTGVALKDGASVYGKFAATTTLGVTSGTHVSITSSALQIKDSGTVYTNLTSGTLTLGNTAAKHTVLDSTGIALNDATVTYGKFAATTTLGATTGKYVSITSSALEFKDSTTVYASLSGTAWTLGTAAGNNILIDSSGVSLKNSSTVYGIFAATTTLGVSTTKHIDIASTYIRLIDNTTTYVDLTGTTLTMGATGGRHVILDTNGVALKDNTTTYGVFAATTTIGATSSKHVSVSSSALQLKDGGSVYTELSGTTLTLGLTSSGDYISIDGTNGLKLYSNAVLLGQWTGAGGVVIGEDANSKSRVSIASGAISLINKSAAGDDSTLISLSAAGLLRVGEYADGKSRVEINAGAVSIIHRAAGADTTKISLDASGNASFAGNITSTSGTIGGFTIGATSLTAGSGATKVGMDAGGTNPAFYAGSDTPGSAPFRVTNAGALTSTSGSIGGWTIGATLSATNLVLTPGAANVANILAGTGATAGGINAANASGDIVFWAGSTYALRASAPFRVTAGGAFTGTTGTVAGDFSVTGSGKLIAGGGQTIIDAGGLELGTYPNLDTSSLPGDGARSISFWTDPAIASGTPRARMYAASDNVGAPYWSVVITPGATGSNPALTLWRETNATSSLWLSNVDSVVGIPGASFNASGVQVTGALSMEGTITAKNHVLPFADIAYNLGSGTYRWNTVYANNLVISGSISGSTLGGQEWEFGGSMTIDANAAANTTVSIVNQNAGAFTASLDVEGNITLGGTVDGVDIASLKSGYDAHVAATAAHGATGAVVGTTNTQTLSGKTFTTLKINDTSANNTYTIGVSELVADRTITLPLLAANDVFVFADFTQTLTNKTLTAPTITDFTNADHTHASAAQGGLVDHTSLTAIGTNTHAQIDTHIAAATAHGISGSVVGTTDTQTLSGKTLTLPKINDTSANHTYIFGVSELAANRTVTLPLLAADDTFVFVGFTQTLTNKTLTTPTIGDFTNAGHAHTNAASGGTIAHTSLTSIGTNTHAQIDTHISTTDTHVAHSTVDMIAGNGLTGGGTIAANRTFTIGAGTMITVNADDVQITNGTAYQFIGTGATTTAGWRNVSELAGGGLTTATGILAVGEGLGITVNANDVALTTPGTLTVSSTNSSTGSHTHTVTSSSNPGANARLLASDASGYLQLVRLGLGRAAATYRLEVQDGILVDRDGLDSYLVFARTATNVAQVRGTTLGLNITDGSGTGSILIVDTTNNRVGVNTAVPTYPLHVTGTAYVSGNTQVAKLGAGVTPTYAIDAYETANSGVTLFRAQNPNVGTGAYALATVASSDTSVSLQAVPSNYAYAAVADAAVLYTGNALHLDIRQATAAGDIRFKIGLTDKVVIDNAGNVGIGTATPLAPLHVEQAVEAAFTGTAKGGIHLDTTSDTDNYYRSISFGRANDVVARIATKRTSTGSLLYFGTSNSYAGGVTNSGIIIDQTGRVAIGGASVPSYTLDVAGGARVTGDLNVDGGMVDLSASGIIDFGTNTIAEDGTYLQFTGAKPIYHGQTVQAASWSITTTGTATLASITAAANLTLNPTGDIILDPAGNDVLPNSNYDISLGSISKKFLTLHAAELWVETLVAQETIATIGGRVLVGQSSSLTSDIAPAATTIYLKHNNFRSGDVGYMEANGQLEFITFTSNPSGTGPYTYTVTRNVDGTGAGTWYAGDVVFNTGITGNGFIDMYSLWSVKGRNLTGVFNWSGSAYSVNYADNASWSVFGDGANNAVNDAVYFGLSGTTWNNLFFNLVTAGVYVATLVWEYWNGAAWTAFTPTATTDFKSTGSKSVTWSTLASWAATDINSVTAYWVRCRISAWTSWTTLPVQGDRKVRGVEKQYGPTIVGNVRNSTTWNDFTERWAIGNLDGLYDYGSDQYGVAFGKESATWLAMDDATGLRIMNNTTTLGSWDASGNITVGDAAGENVYVTSAGVYLRSGTTAYTSLVGTTLTLGYNIAGGEYVTIDATSGVCLYGAGTLLGNWTAAGGIVIGDNTNNDKSRIEITSGALNFITDIGGTDSTRVSISTAGKVTVGVATGNHIEITSTTFDIMYNTTPKISMDSSGNASFSGAIAVGSTLTIGTAGAIVTTGVTYASGTGVFLGYDSTAYKFRVGTAAGNRVVWDGTDFFWQGVNTSLTKAGLFTADDADIAGVITAETGYIGGTSGWVIASKKITSSNIGIYAGTANLEAKIEVGTGTTAYTAGINSANATGQIAFWAGATWINRAAAPFRVTIDGGLTSTSGEIGDWTIAASSLSATNLVLTSGAAGTANIRVGDGSTPSITAGINSPASATEIAFWAGQTFASKTTAPFRVTAAGIATMTGATLLGSAMGVTLYPTFALKFEGPMAGNGVNVNSFDGRQGVASGSIIGVAGKFGKAYQMAPANTNLVQNPSIEVDTTGYTANVSGSTLTRDGTSYKFGVYSLRTVCDGVSANQGWYYNIPNAVTASTWYSGGVWLRSVTGATITLALINQSGGATFATTSITLTNIWTWYRVSGQTPVGCTAARIAVYQPAAASLVFYTDGVQFETGQFSTPYADGSLGIGHAWAGTAHASNSTRAGLSYLVYGGARDWLPERIGALSVWFYPIKRVGGSYQTIFRYDGSTGYVMLRINDSGDTVASYWGTTSSNTSNTVTYDTWNHIAMTINGSTKIMYLNGVKTTGSVGSNFSLSASGNASVGYSTAGDQFMGYVDDLFIMPYVLSDQEVQQLYQSNLPANIASGSGELKLSSSTTQAAIIGSSQGIVAYSDTGAESFALANESFNWGAQYVSGSILSAGDFVLGDPDARHLFYDASAGTLSIKSNTVERIGLSATGVLTIKDSSGNAKISLDASGNASFAGAITVDTSLTVGSTGKIITSGVTNVSTGAGVFLGYESSQYQFRVGNPSGDKLLWNGTNLVITGSIDLPTVDIDSNGIRVQTDPVNFLNAHSYRFENGGVNVGGLYAFQNASLTNVTVSSNCTPGGDAVAVNTDALGVITVVSKGDAKTAQIYLEAIGKKTDGTSAQTASLTIVGKPSTAGGTSATLTAGTIGLTGNTTVTGTLNVTSTLTRNGNTVWDAGNDGSGTGLNADLLDGLHDTSFLRMDANNVGTDTDLYYGLGKAKIGYAGFADSATFAHVDQHTTTGYALSQTAAGDTFLNAKTGNKIYLRNNDNAIGNIDNDGIHLGTGKYIDSLVPYKRNGTDGYLFVPLHVAGLTDNNGQVWAQSGTDFPLSGNVYFNMGATANGTVPDAAKAVVIFAKAKWTEVVNSYYLAFRARGGSVNDMLLYPHAVDQYATIQGIVWLDATNHDFEMINGSSVKFVDDISITLIGYFI